MVVWVVQASGAAVFLGVPAIGPQLSADFGLERPNLGWVFAALTFGAGLSVVPWGRLADRVGERLVLLAGLGLTAASLGGLAGLSGGRPLLVLLTVAGVGSASTNAATSRAVVMWFGPEQRGMAMGIRQTALPIGAGGAALILPAVAVRWSAHMAFGLLASTCALTAVLVAVALRDAGATVDQLDVAGRSAADTAGWRRSRRRRIITATVLLAAPQLSLSSFLMVFLIQDHGWSPGRAAAVLACTQFAGAAVRPLVGRYSDTHGDRIGPMAAIAVVAAGALLLLAVAAPVGGALLVLAALSAGVSTLSWNGLAATAAGELAAPGRTGAVLGWQTAAVFLGGAVAAPCVDAIALATSWQVAFAMLAIPAAAAAAVLWPLRKPRAPSVDHLLARALISMDNVAISLIDVSSRDQRVTYINAAFEQLTGYGEAEAVGQPWTIVEGPETDPTTAAQLREAISRGRDIRVRVRHHRRDGRSYWSEMFLSPIVDGTSAATHYVTVQKDVTASTDAERRATHLAYHDALTGLPNRTHAEEHLAAALDAAAVRQGGVALLFLDLDGFKVANDRYGHDAGDQLLQLTAHRWQAVTRSGDLLARHGGDEFVVVITGLDPATTHAAATAAAKRLVRAMSEPFEVTGWPGVQIGLGVSIGIAHYPDDGHSAQDLQAAADDAMYEVKRRRAATRPHDTARPATSAHQVVVD